MARIEVLHEYECHPRFGWQRCKQLPEGLEPASRRTDADYGKWMMPVGFIDRACGWGVRRDNNALLAPGGAFFTPHRSRIAFARLLGHQPKDTSRHERALCFGEPYGRALS